jgi:hypothetical protein
MAFKVRGVVEKKKKWQPCTNSSFLSPQSAASFLIKKTVTKSLDVTGSLLKQSRFLSDDQIRRGVQARIFEGQSQSSAKEGESDVVPKRHVKFHNLPITSKKKLSGDQVSEDTNSRPSLTKLLYRRHILGEDSSLYR